jgi:hypothetical protein
MRPDRQRGPGESPDPTKTAGLDTSTQHGTGRTNPVDAILAEVVGQQIPGGCEHCDAYQTVATARDKFAAVIGDDDPDDYLAGCFVCTVHHDDWCPWWLRNQNRQARRAAVRRAKRSRVS